MATSLMDDDGFIRITTGSRRFSKIGGEWCRMLVEDELHNRLGRPACWLSLGAGRQEGERLW
jgi:hypothetical protein